MAAPLPPSPPTTCDVAQSHERCRATRSLHNRREGSNLDADHPTKGVKIACRSTAAPEQGTGVPATATAPIPPRHFLLLIRKRLRTGRWNVELSPLDLAHPTMARLPAVAPLGQTRCTMGDEGCSSAATPCAATYRMLIHLGLRVHSDPQGGNWVIPTA